MELKVPKSPEQKKAEAVERMRKAREAKQLMTQHRKGQKLSADPPAPHNGNGTLMEPSFDLERFFEMLGALTVDFLNKNFAEQTLRDLCYTMRDTLERCNKRLQQLENARTAMLCDHCHKVLPGGRFAGEIVIRDEITNELRALRACGESCYREISRVANERRAKYQGSIRGTVAM
jgi:hypothetical protein